MSQPTAATTEVPALTIDWYIDMFVKGRDRIAELDNEHKEAMRPRREALARLEGAIMQYLQDTKQTSAKTEAGTAYISTTTSVTVNGWSKTLEYIQQRELWELLEARVSKTAALSIIEETKEPIPGVVVRQEDSINVRRPTRKAPE